MSARRKPGVLCLEGEWYGAEDRTSVQPMLEMLERSGHIRAMWRDVATREELRFYVDRWTHKSWADYPLLYLAFHGAPGEFFVGKTPITLDDLAADLAGKCNGRILHFGSCATLAIAPAALEAFRQETGAHAVSGYTAAVDWLEASAFEILLVNELIKSGDVETVRARLSVEHAAWARALGFSIVAGD
jgi:hypothetical protein